MAKNPRDLQVKVQTVSEGAFRTGLLSKLKKEAEKFGCAVEALVDTERTAPRVWKRRLLVNGNVCHVCYLRSSMKFRKDSPSSYVGTTVGKKKLNMATTIIIRVEVPRYEHATFVIPVEDLLAGRKETLKRSGSVNILIPLKRNPRPHGHDQLIDWSEFKDAWEVIPR